mmetsp:Transcript_78884/g.109302  ORF Transcript_78884/g.109302 Transcript_78884/m.109302 type:complete len:155 (+) Transcript_78884:532-996(+)
MISFLLMINLTFLGMFFFVFPYMFDDAWLPILLSLFVLSQFFMFKAACKHPGTPKGTSKLPFLDLVENFDPNLLCPTCEVVINSDLRHCYICNECVSRFDHHCQWLDTCIGSQNHGYFIFFISTLALYMSLITYTCFDLLINEDINSATISELQ